MLRKLFVFAFLTVSLAFFGEPKCWAKVINIPGDESTIQGGIDAASDGDTVQVSPGTYFENLNFNGKLITVTSTGGPTVTTIDGHRDNAGGDVFFWRNQPSAVLSGFTITNGLGPLSSPTQLWRRISK